MATLPDSPTIGMTSSSAERWITTSAAIVIGVYAYRRFIEPAQPGKLKNTLGIGPPVPLGQFATGWGFTFLVVAILAQASPGLGGGFAILIAAGDLLTNSANVFGDVQKQEKGGLAAGLKGAGTQANVATIQTAATAQQIAGIAQRVGTGRTIPAGQAAVGQTGQVATGSGLIGGGF